MNYNHTIIYIYTVYFMYMCGMVLTSTQYSLVYHDFLLRTSTSYKLPSLFSTLSLAV